MEKECQFRVEITQSSGTAGFEFNRFDDTRDFVNVCMECCDNNTKITILKREG